MRSVWSEGVDDDAAAADLLLLSGCTSIQGSETRQDKTRQGSKDPKKHKMTERDDVGQE